MCVRPPEGRHGTHLPGAEDGEVWHAAFSSPFGRGGRRSRSERGSGGGYSIWRFCDAPSPGPSRREGRKQPAPSPPKPLTPLRFRRILRGKTGGRSAE